MRLPAMNRTPALVLPVLALGFALGGCTDRALSAFGEANSIIVAAPDSLWAAVEESALPALEPTVFTVRDERSFNVTHVAPTTSEWGRLREFKQVLVIGRADDPWIRPVLRRTSPSLREGEPAIVQASEIWAGEQFVTAVVLPDDDDDAAGDPAATLRAVLPEVHERIDERFRAYTLERMFVSGADTALADTLRRDAGFALTVPNVYAWSALDSATYRFLNTYPRPSELIRSVLVTWRAGAADDDALTPDSVLAWRDRLADAWYEYYTQVTTRDRVESRTPPGAPGSDRALEVAGIWTTPDGDFPAAGSFLSRMVACPEQDRTYFLDAWLYAPGSDKYEYMLQLQTILDSFECG
ncbi:MAG: DUF4837 family protein [Gemmatimonadota bacterium]